MNHPINRFHYRGSLNREYTDAELKAAVSDCKSRIQSLIKKERLMTAALYHYKHMLFLYCEAVGEEICPEKFCASLTPYMETWPGVEGSRIWADMYHIYYHAVPESVEDWKRPTVPTLRRGRIAFLYTDKLYSYIYHHLNIVKEGLLTGDKYQSIALHENILFSYFEEPKTMINIQRDTSLSSQAIKDWLAVDPESHFIHLPECKGENFMFLPAYFALGTECASNLI